MEQPAPPPEKRFCAMQQFARPGILTETGMMPVLPGPCDTHENLEATVHRTAGHSG
jgi:DNA repair photolyase